MMRRMALIVGLLAGISATGCVAQSSKRMGVHTVRDARIVHKENPTEATERLVLGNEAQAEYLGAPKDPVKVEDFEADLKQLKTDSVGLFGRFPWLKVILGGLGSIVLTAAGLAGAKYGFLLRAGMGILTAAIEKTGTKAVKDTVAAASKGTKTGALIHRWAKKAEEANGKKPQPVSAPEGV